MVVVFQPWEALVAAVVIVESLRAVDSVLRRASSHGKAVRPGWPRRGLYVAYRHTSSASTRTSRPAGFTLWQGLG